MSDFLKVLESQIILGDGAMGTQIYAKGVPLGRCYDELNISNPHLIRMIHREYVDAGAELIETNTFTANRFRLKRYELERRVRDFNLAGVKIAREFSGKGLFVAGSVGPLTSTRKDEQISRDSRYEIFVEQITALVDGGVDILILETFTDLDEVTVALAAARDVCRLPVVCQMAFVEKMKTPLGVEAGHALVELEKAGADVIGANCTVPFWTTKALEVMGSRTHAKLSAYPNAGLPEYVDGRYMYLTTPEYFAETARTMVNAGANLVGGCCGTAPEHIRTLARELKGARPMPRRLLVRASVASVAKQKEVEEAPPRVARFFETIGQEMPVVVELDPPRGLAYQKVLKGALRLHEAGVDAITVGDNPLAVMRMGHVGMAYLMEREGVQTILHLSCRDRNLIGLQSVILESHILGITSLLAITGDPAKVGDQPQASSVYDLNSFDLIRLVSKMNQGMNHADNSISGKTSFKIGCAFNPNVRDLDMQVRRLRKKIDAGAHYALSQPFYDVARVHEIYGRIRAIVGDFPVFFGVLPPVSARNAQFLAHEVPGIKIPDAVLQRMREAPEAKQRDEGLAIARGLIDAAMDVAPGFYMIPPFGSIDLSVELIRYVKSQWRARKRSTSVLGSSTH